MFAKPPSRWRQELASRFYARLEDEGLARNVTEALVLYWLDRSLRATDGQPLYPRGAAERHVREWLFSEETLGEFPQLGGSDVV